MKPIRPSDSSSMNTFSVTPDFDSRTASASVRLIVFDTGGHEKNA